MLDCRSELARDLPGTGSKYGKCGVAGETELQGLRLLRSRSRASSLLQI